MLAIIGPGAVGFIDWLGDLLKVVRQLVSRLVELDVVRARHRHHYNAAVIPLLDWTSKLRPFPPQIGDGGLDVIAHQSDQVVTRGIVALALPLAVRRVHSHLARPAFENEPIVIKILRNVPPAEHVTQKCPCSLCIVGVDQRVNRGNHVVI